MENEPGLRIDAQPYYGLGDVENASFILLHELGHVTGILENDERNKVKDYEQAGERNNQKVYEACFKD